MPRETAAITQLKILHREVTQGLQWETVLQENMAITATVTQDITIPRLHMTFIMKQKHLLKTEGEKPEVQIKRR